MSESIDNIKTKICDACDLYKKYYYTLKSASYMPYPVGPAAQSVIKSGGELCRYCAIYDANKLIVTKHAQELLDAYSNAMKQYNDLKKQTEDQYNGAMKQYNGLKDQYNKIKLIKEPVAELSAEPVTEPVTEPVALELAEGGYKRKRSRKRRSSKRKQNRLSKRKSIKKKSKKNRRR